MYVELIVLIVLVCEYLVRIWLFLETCQKNSFNDSNLAASSSSRPSIRTSVGFGLYRTRIVRLPRWILSFADMGRSKNAGAVHRSVKGPKSKRKEPQSDPKEAKGDEPKQSEEQESHLSRAGKNPSLRPI